MVSLLVTAAIVAAAIAFALGVFAVPIYATVVGDAIPVISPLVGKLAFVLGALSNGTNVWHYTEDDRYEIRSADVEAFGPDSLWTRFALSRFGVNWERTRDALGDVVKDYDLEYMAEESPERDKLPGNRHPIDIERGGLKSYIRTDLDPDALFVAVGEKLAELQDSAGIHVPNETHMETLKDEGGDTNDYTTAQMGVITAVFFILGLVGALLAV